MGSLSKGRTILDKQKISRKLKSMDKPWTQKAPRSNSSNNPHQLSARQMYTMKHTSSQSADMACNWASGKKSSQVNSRPQQWELPKVVKYWSSLHREVVEFPSLAIFKTQLDMALSNQLYNTALKPLQEKQGSGEDCKKESAVSGSNHGSHWELLGAQLARQNSPLLSECPEEDCCMTGSSGTLALGTCQAFKSGPMQNEGAEYFPHQIDVKDSRLAYSAPRDTRQMQRSTVTFKAMSDGSLTQRPQRVNGDAKACAECDTSDPSQTGIGALQARNIYYEIQRKEFAFYSLDFNSGDFKKKTLQILGCAREQQCHCGMTQGTLQRPVPMGMLLLQTQVAQKCQKPVQFSAPIESDKAFETPLPFQTPSPQLLSEGSSRLAGSGARGRMPAPARAHNPRFCPINCRHILPQAQALGTAAERQAQAGTQQQHQQQNYPIKLPE
ncbi:hypothetical protein QYF61_002883 [Mycteria americana]|uniref:Uncharacterized protein n=1 Tax=Mycteria americana TaxID=33587 RepID=A0AAN7N3H5_MYCAM|nr:hypothetical protein QYF61_002883 [Mycteria americana]